MRHPISVQDDKTACFSGGRTLVMRQPSTTRSRVAPAKPKATENTTVQASRCAGSPKRDAGERRHDAELRDDDPGAAPPEDAPEQGRIVLVQERRPEELELVGEGQFAQEPDRREGDPGVGQPGRLRRIDEKERDAGGEPEARGQARSADR